MLTRMRKRLSYANVMASAAVFIALGGVGYAAAAKNSVISTSIKNGQVKNLDLANNAVTAAKIRDGNVGSADIADASVARSDLAAGVAGLRAYGLISGADGSASLAKGIVSVNKPAANVFCVAFDPSLGIGETSLIVPIQNTLNTPGGELGTTRFEVRFDSPPTFCAAGAATVIVYDSAFGPRTNSFFLLVP